MAFTKIARALLRAGDELKEILIAELIVQEHIASGKLINSFDVKFNIVGSSLTIDIVNSAGYAIAVDEGVKSGTEVGIGKLIRWVRQKAGRGFLRASTEAAVFIIAKRVNRSIRERGTVSPKGFIENGLHTAEAVGIFNQISNAIGVEVDVMLGEKETDATLTVIATI
jgi:hypothetical protein